MAELPALRINTRRQDSGRIAELTHVAQRWCTLIVKSGVMAGVNYTTRRGRGEAHGGLPQTLVAGPLSWRLGQSVQTTRGLKMRRIRFAKIESTTVEASETTRIVPGEVKTQRSLRVTRTSGSLFELLIPGLSMSGTVINTSSDDFPVPDGQRQLRAEDPMAISN
jgi:hypothetical protein